MAEFGDPFFLSNDPQIDRIHVTDAMMDFPFVQKTCNKNELLAIRRRLKSEDYRGQFRELEQAVENRILVLLPEKHRRRIASIQMEPTTADVKQAKEGFDAWLESAKRFNKEHAENFDSTFGSPLKYELENEYLPSVRGSVMAKWKAAGTNKNICSDLSSQQERAKLRISKETMSNHDYFSAWDKYDVEAAEREIDELENGKLDDKGDVSLQNAVGDKIQRAKKRHELELSLLQEKVKVERLTNTERSAFAELERQKGNEYFRCGENDEAINCYSKSIAYDGKNAIVFSNRAMAAIRLSYMEQALADTTMALELDPTCTKARARRGSVHHQCGRYANAVEDFQVCSEQEPENKHYALLLKRSEEQRMNLQEDLSHERTKTRLVIQEKSCEKVETSDVTNQWNHDITNDMKRLLGGENQTLDSKTCIATQNIEVKEIDEVITPGARIIMESQDRSLENDSRNETRQKRADGARAKSAHSAPRKGGGYSESPCESSTSFDSIHLDRTTTNNESNNLKEEGNTALKDGRVEDAVRLYTLAIVITPKSYALRNNRALAYLKLERWELAEKDASLALHIEPTSTKALYRRGCARMMQNSYDCLLQAKLDFTAILATEPRNELVQNKLNKCEDAIMVSLSAKKENTPGSKSRQMAPPQDLAENDFDSFHEKHSHSHKSKSLPRNSQPSTATEFEMIIRSFHSESDEKLIKCLRSLKKSSYKKILTETISLETLAKILQSMEIFFSRDPKEAIIVMTEIAKNAKALYLSFMCLDEATKASVQRILRLSEDFSKVDAEILKNSLACWFV